MKKSIKINKGIKLIKCLAETTFKNNRLIEEPKWIFTFPVSLVYYSTMCAMAT